MTGAPSVARACSASGRTLDGPQPNRPSAGTSSAGRGMPTPGYPSVSGGWRGAAGGRGAQGAAGVLLLEDVRAPAGGAGTGEHRGEHVRRDLGEVQDDRGPELDVGLDRPVGTPLAQLLEGGLLQGQGGLEAGCTQLLGGAAQHAGAGVLGAVDAVADAPEPVTLVEAVLDVLLGVAALLDTVEHVQHPRGGAAVQRAGHGADRAGQRGRDVGAGGG